MYTEISHCVEKLTFNIGLSTLKINSPHLWINFNYKKAYTIIMQTIFHGNDILLILTQKCSLSFLLQLGS